MDIFTNSQLRYLSSQRLGRLATVDRQGAPQNSPVGFRVEDDGTVVIRGRNLSQSRKFHNVVSTGRVSLVVDDIASVDPWRVRGVEIRGPADAVSEVDAAAPDVNREEIRIHPERIIGWGIDETAS